MPTFFEKLTGGRATSTRPEEPKDPVPPTKEEVQRHIKKPLIEESKTEPQGEKPTHLKIEEEGREKHAKMEDEEGELTVDIYDEGETIVIQATVAGVRPEDLDVSITNDNVSIIGKRTHPEGIRESDYYYKELFWGNFSRSIILPEEVEEEHSEANLKHGLLTIRLPKKIRGVTQKLKVKVS